jgi:glycosyltransferase involved in cell wall biosynthesis
MAALIGKILESTDFSLACAGLSKEVGSIVRTSEDDRISCFDIPARGGLAACSEVAEEWKPDLIHIHGTENFFGLLSARRLVNCPVVISIQGLLGPCSEWYRYFGNHTLPGTMKLHRWLDLPALRGQWIEYLKTKRAAKTEREIIRGNRFFMGRTAWDRAYIASLNPSSRYYHAGELLRDAFRSQRWDLRRAERHRIILSSAAHPRKGAEVLFEAVKHLRPDYPDTRIAIAGSISRRSGYGRYMRRRIGELGAAVEELGPLNAQRMAEELGKSHLLVSPSFIENSSNSICEAQLIGMPVIASYTGGIPSLIEDGRTGLFFPTGDAPMLAARIREVLESDDLAAALGCNAHKAAAERHDPGRVVAGVVAAYEEIVRNA